MAQKMGPISVDIKARVKPFLDGVKKAQKSVSKFSDTVSRKMKSVRSSMTTAKAGITALVGAMAIGKTTDFITSTVEGLDRIGKSAKAAGISAGQLQEFQFALGQIAGVSKDQVSVALRDFNKRMGEAKMGTGEAKSAFEALGISLEQDTGAALDEAIQKLAGMEDSQEASALAAKLFGEQGAQLAASLRGQGEAFDELSKFSRENLNATDEQVKKAEAMNDIFDTLRKSTMKQFVDTIMNNSQAIVTLANAIAQLPSIAINAVKLIINGWRNLLGSGKVIFEEIKNAAKAALTFDFDYDYSGVGRRIQEGLAQVSRETRAGSEEAFSNIREGIQRMFDPPDVGALQEAGEKARQVAEDQEEANNGVTASLTAQSAARERLNAILQRGMTKQETYAQQVRKLVEDLALANATEEERAKAIAILGEEYSRTIEKVKEATKESENLATAIGKEVSSAVRQATTDVSSLDNAFKSMFDNVIRKLVDEKIFNPFSAMLETGIGKAGSLLGGLFGSRRSGGPMNAGQPYVVGESGPELVVPRANSMVFNSARTAAIGGGATGNVNIEFINRGTPQQPQDVQQTVTPEGLIVTVIADDARRGGPITKTIQSIARRR